MVESASQWICLNLSSLNSRRTVASGLVPHSVLLPGSSSTNPWNNGKSCLLCSPKKCDVITRLKEWRVADLISQDISYQSWHVNKESRINLSSGAKAEIRNVDPRFTTGTCTTLLSAVGVWVDSKSILIAEIFDFDSEGTASRTMSVNVSEKTILTDWRYSLMLQERWEGSVLARIVAFFFATWTIRSMHK